ncbi:PEP/pyruvate-binding domain-containing protein [Sulfuriroseicoccus oceanibius]|uniref:Uncharacterized protein n=1 Tax=Sulfuriroseicoccus oceanibius TaxID=2707525 RepID=A0A6B3LB42_9BACT|nr:PEP/pyruvate-binding domain-containing protein [Sulfuriroseicoccus oceanibius]QQL44245.1 hypothetical protein G3M56_010105 [Sulfuriroseicoccus oceanibius]
MSIIPFSHELATDPAVVGGKSAALARLTAAGLPVPAGFSVPNDDAPTTAELQHAVDSLGGSLFAVRSSATEEDGANHSFAGQFDSFLELSADQVAKHVEKVRASASAPAIQQYAKEHALPAPSVPAVLVQRMIPAEFAGVAFSADPVSGRRSVVVISAVTGTGEKLVSGDVDGETWTCDHGGHILSQPEKPELSAAQAGRVARLAIACAEYFEHPQDIEWAIVGDDVFLLQSRPITTLGALPDPDEPLTIWDNSNIAESYSGLTLPLTFSFARRAYEHVYREFCKILSVPESRIEAHDDVFPKMLGQFRGQVYYNLVSWYRVLAMLPGYQVNRRFMEQMMGVKEPLPDEISERIAAEMKSSKAADTIALSRTLAALVWRRIRLGGTIDRFNHRLEAALREETPVAEMTGPQLVAHYRDLERQLLKQWDAPLINDFFAMIIHGVLRATAIKWLGDESHANELVSGCRDIVSAEPPRRIAEMATIARTNHALAKTLADPDIPAATRLNALRQNHQLGELFTSYLDKFGDRCLGELKLESPTVADDPAALLQSIGAMALRPPAPADAAPPESTDEQTFKQIRSPLKRWMFRRIVNEARDRVQDRENLRFERTRLFGRVRKIAKALGRHLATDGLLDSADDAFHLDLATLLGVYEGTHEASQLRDSVEASKQCFARHAAAPPPPDRFTTRGAMHRHADVQESAPAAACDGDALQGLGACRGVVRGKVRVVIDPTDARLEPGEILVARQTDPGWVVLFPSASGLLVERGSLLSHSAIVARELNLPCVVSLSHITRTLQTGDEVEMDGSTGSVRILTQANSPS